MFHPNPPDVSGIEQKFDGFPSFETIEVGQFSIVVPQVFPYYALVAESPFEVFKTCQGQRVNFILVRRRAAGCGKNNLCFPPLVIQPSQIGRRGVVLVGIREVIIVYHPLVKPHFNFLEREHGIRFWFQVGVFQPPL